MGGPDQDKCDDPQHAEPERVCHGAAAGVKKPHVPNLSVRIETDLAGVRAAQWDALDHGGSPFLEYGFLRALERSKSIGDAAGWAQHYILVERGVGDEVELVGAVAAFLKDHSYGEYIFDFGWARAAQRSGVPYYPKLVIAAPVTPATGRRILLAPSLAPDDRLQVTQLLIAAVRELADVLDVGSVHWLFCTESETGELANAGFMPRASFQFHWKNAGYADFDAFLAQLSSRKRKQIRKERRRALDAVDGAVEFVPGHALSDSDVQTLDGFYRRTCAMHGGQDYLQPGFFETLRETLPNRMLFARVKQQGATVAGALYLQTESALYGRYWGCAAEIPFLHFETAYYAGVERCIDRGLALFEAGAQGEHKLLRGFVPSATYSNHWIRHRGLSNAVRRSLRDEARSLPSYMRELGKYAPFRRGNDGELLPMEPAPDDGATTPETAETEGEPIAIEAQPAREIGEEGTQ